MALVGFPVPFLSPEISVSFRLLVAVGGLEPPLIAGFEASPSLGGIFIHAGCTIYRSFTALRDSAGTCTLAHGRLKWDGFRHFA